jgi:hypothetical protein
VTLRTTATLIGTSEAHFHGPKAFRPRPGVQEQECLRAGLLAQRAM